jgi:hypothetical protein
MWTVLWFVAICVKLNISYVTANTTVTEHMIYRPNRLCALNVVDYVLHPTVTMKLCTTHSLAYWIKAQYLKLFMIYPLHI